MTTTHPGRFPSGLLGAVVVVAMVEMTVARWDLDLSRTDLFDHRVAYHAASSKRQAIQADVLCLGTSMVEEGMLPRVVERGGGGKAYNLAVSGGRPATSYYYLKRALDAGAKPSAVVVDFHPGFLMKPYVPDGRYWVDSMGIGDCLEMARTLKSPSLFASTIMVEVLPTLYHRRSIREAIGNGLQGREFSLRNDNLAHMRNRNQNQGAFIAPLRLQYAGEIDENYRSSLLKNAEPYNPREVHYIRELLRLAEARNVRVYWLVCPFSPTLQDGREANGQDARFTRFLDSFRAPNLVILDARHAEYDVYAFRDASHLNLEGAKILSAEVAEMLAHPPDQRYAALPRYRWRPIELPIETITESAMAVSEMTGIRR